MADLITALRNAHAAGDDAAARRIAGMMTPTLDPNAGIGPMQAGAIGAGKGLYTLGRGLGLADDESPAVKAAYENLAGEHPIATTIGEVAGESAPFLLPGMAVAGLPSKAARVAGAVGVGGAEGAIITKGLGGNISEIIKSGGLGSLVAGGAEILFPVLTRFARKIYGKAYSKGPKGPLLTSEGLPTAELQDALEATGTSFDEIAGEAIEKVNSRGVDAQQASRAARMESQGIPATQGDISQLMPDQASEQRLMSMSSGDKGEPLRQMKLRQSQEFEGAVNNLVDELGVPGDAGQSMKDAISGRKKVLKDEKNALYASVMNASPELKQVPVITDDIKLSLPDSEVVEDLSITAPQAVENARVALARFGIDTTEEGAELLRSRGLEPQPLTVGNFERFRKTLNSVERADQTGAVKVITGPIKDALDGEVDLLSNAIQASGVDGGEVIESLKKARKIVRTIKTEFSPQSITGKLIGLKRDGVTPVIEASKAAESVLKPTAPIEHLEQTMVSLNRAGPRGKQAIKDMQASVIMKALDDALKAPSRKTSGIQTIAGGQFGKSLQKFGDDKLKVLFKDSPKELQRLKGLQQTAFDISPDERAIPKGSAPIIMDLVKRVGGTPGIAAIRDGIGFVIGAGSDERKIRAAMNSRPKIKRSLTAISNDYPSIASAIGISFLAHEEQ